MTKDTKLSYPNTVELEDLKILFNKENYDLVEIRTKSLIQKYPNVPMLYNILGVSQSSRKMFKEAIVNFEKAIKLDPKLLDAYNNLGITLKNSGNLLVVSWGGTFGAVRSAVEKAQSQGISVSQIHLRYINPFPENLGELMLKFQQILVPELNSGQLSILLRNKYLIDSVGLNKVEGQPFTTDDILNKIIEMAGV